MRGKRSLVSALLLTTALILASTPSFAHHSMSAYDSSRSVTLKATITNFAWTNPHVQIQFNVPDDNGNSVAWMAECPSPNRLAHRGWHEDTLKPGDQVTIVGNPAKDGAKEMRLEAVTLSSGQEMTAYRR